MHFDVVLSECIHPCSKKWRRVQFSIHAELTRLLVCASHRGKLLTQRASVLYSHLVPSGSPYIESWYVRLNENVRVGGNA